MDSTATLRARIENCQATIGILGLGYVGLPLSLAFAEKFSVIGYDPSRKVVDNLQKGRTSVQDVSESELKAALEGHFSPTAEEKPLGQADVFIICVPTPLDQAGEPDLRFVSSASATIARALRPGCLVILESTTYPGTTEEIVRPILEETGLVAGKDFHLAYSPERVDPGNKKYGVKQIPKIVGGFTPTCGALTESLYNSVLDHPVFCAQDAKTAEFSKIFENIFRDVNIALVNEMSLVAERMGVNFWDVIEGARTKPFGFMPFYPGPGVGGHCIPLDPRYLSYRARQFGFIPRFIELSTEINDFMKIHAVNMTRESLKSTYGGHRGKKVLLLGVAYKKDSNDVRESPAIKISAELVKAGVEVRFFDPLIEEFASEIDGNHVPLAREADLGLALGWADAALIVTDHTEIKQGLLGRVDILGDKPVIDCRNMLAGHTHRLNYVGLGNGAAPTATKRAPQG